jgi:hypothetical protein
MLLEKKISEWEKAQDELEPMPEPLVVPGTALDGLMTVLDEKRSDDVNEAVNDPEIMERIDLKPASKSYKTMNTTSNGNG